MRYIAFDVETPNRFNHRMSAIGITIIEDGAIVDSMFSLVNPETHFDPFNIELTGIDEKRVADAPTFGELWRDIEPVMSSGLLVAHNAVFDMSVLKKCLQAYSIQWVKSAPYLCTVKMGRRLLPDMGHGLAEMCRHYDIALDHHQADSDSRACAEILLRYLREGADIKSFIRRYKFEG